MARHRVIIESGPGFSNAVRMSLLNDTTSLAACRVEFEKNTSCFNNEFLAHRIGITPFRKSESAGLELTLDVVGPRRVYAKDFQGLGVEPVHGEIMIACLGNAEQALRLRVHFDEKPGKTHARYMSVSAVGMKPTHGAQKHELTFETVDERRSARALCAEALDHLEARLDKALLALANQPSEPPRSRC